MDRKVLEHKARAKRELELRMSIYPIYHFRPLLEILGIPESKMYNEWNPKSWAEVERKRAKLIKFLEQYKDDEYSDAAEDAEETTEETSDDSSEEEKEEVKAE